MGALGRPRHLALTPCHLRQGLVDMGRPWKKPALGWPFPQCPGGEGGGGQGRTFQFVLILSASGHTSRRTHSLPEAQPSQP